MPMAFCRMLGTIEDPMVCSNPGGEERYSAYRREDDNVRCGFLAIRHVM
jgi:hypothetical protein